MVLALIPLIPLFALLIVESVNGISLWSASLSSLILALVCSHRASRSLDRRLQYVGGLIAAVSEGDPSIHSARNVYGDCDVVAQSLRRLSTQMSEGALHHRYVQDVLDSMNEGILVTDLIGFVTYANGRARDLLDTPHREILGEHIATLITGRWDIDSSSHIRREAILHRIEGDQREVVIERTNLTGQNGRLQGMLFVVEDVTEKNRLARDLANYRDMLARSERLSALGTLGAIIAHKLSQPISSVRLFLQQIQRDLKSLPVSELVRGNLQESLAELDRIAAMTKQMLRSGRGELAVFSGSSRGSSVLRAAIKVKESLRDTARHRGIALSVRCAEPDIQVACSPLELEEVLYCLVTNSLQAGTAGANARVDVDISRRAGVALIIVADTCGGISSDHIDRIFDCFFTTKEDSQGTGLGLAIVRHIVERYGGTVKVHSEEGAGSCFTISLPVSEEVQYGHGSEGVRC